MPKIKLTAEFTEVLTFEDYPTPVSISGVWTTALKKHRSENGAFMEYMRLDQAGAQDLPSPLIPRQISISWAAPKRINAFHIHVKEEQNEIWCVIAGQLTVWLIDCRLGSATTGIKKKIILQGEQPALLYIPSGVAHGYQAGDEGATLVYSMDAQFNLEDPNEGRIPWDVFGAQLWDENRG